MRPVEHREVRAQRGAVEDAWDRLFDGHCSRRG
jgi:hypothetical protein